MVIIDHKVNFITKYIENKITSTINKAESVLKNDATSTQSNISLL